IQTLNAARGASVFLAVRVLPFITGGGTAFIANNGSRALQYLQSFGPRGVQILQAAFIRSPQVITRNQAPPSSELEYLRATEGCFKSDLECGKSAEPRKYSVAPYRRSY